MDLNAKRWQVEAARASVLALEAPDLLALVVTGKDRVSWLNGLLTCDLVKRPEGEGRYGLLVLRNGRVLSDATVVIDETRAFVVLPASLVETVRAHLDHYLVMEDAVVDPRTDAFAVWTLHGPRSGDVLAAARAAGGTGAIADRTGLGGAVVLVPDAHATEVREALEQAVASFGGVAGDEGGWEALRLERGVARFGVDFDDKTYPQEASLEKVAVSFDKGCYLGQEVVCMLQMRGHVKRRLVPMVIDGDTPPDRGAPVTDEGGAAVGEVTSATTSPTLGKVVALAMIKRAQAEGGQQVVVGGTRAEVVDRPA
jgi:tRNA-modifying protein YgfZ